MSVRTVEIPRVDCRRAARAFLRKRHHGGCDEIEAKPAAPVRGAIAFLPSQAAGDPSSDRSVLRLHVVTDTGEGRRNVRAHPP
jgi:hypothetical protein